MAMSLPFVILSLVLILSSASPTGSEQQECYNIVKVLGTCKISNAYRNKDTKSTCCGLKEFFGCLERFSPLCENPKYNFALSGLQKTIELSRSMYEERNCRSFQCHGPLPRKQSSRQELLEALKTSEERRKE